MNDWCACVISFPFPANRESHDGETYVRRPAGSFLQDDYLGNGVNEQDTVENPWF